MKITIQYESETLLPKELAEEFEKMRKRIYENRYELDKIEIFIGNMKNSLTRWIDANKIEVK